jgi:hypothetical protein
MCFGTAVQEVEQESSEQLDQNVEGTEASFESDADVMGQKASEALSELALMKAVEANVQFASILGKQGVHSVARALLMLPLEGKITPEQKEAFKSFISSEAKRLVAGALAAEKEQGDFSGR